ncbi:ZBT10 protein, partial [Atractosteus spatula]|nr:ZBT10 protein [Atractosteus spatula]
MSGERNRRSLAFRGGGLAVTGASGVGGGHGHSWEAQAWQDRHLNGNRPEQEEDRDLGARGASLGTLEGGGSPGLDVAVEGGHLTEVSVLRCSSAINLQPTAPDWSAPGAVGSPAHYPLLKSKHGALTGRCFYANTCQKPVLFSTSPLGTSWLVQFPTYKYTSHPLKYGFFMVVLSCQMSAHGLEQDRQLRFKGSVSFFAHSERFTWKVSHRGDHRKPSGSKGVFHSRFLFLSPCQDTEKPGDADGEDAEYRNKPNENSYCYQLLQELNKQRKNGILCDVNIVVSGQVFRAHKNILVAGSRFFKTLYCLTKNESCDQTTITHLDVAAVQGFSVILDFLYSGNLLLTSQNAIEVMSVASYLQMTEVVQSCRAFIKDALNISIKSEAPDSVVVDYNKRRAVTKDGKGADKKPSNFWATSILSKLSIKASGHIKEEPSDVEGSIGESYPLSSSGWGYDNSSESAENEPQGPGPVFVWNDAAIQTGRRDFKQEPGSGRRKNQTTRRYVYNMTPEPEESFDEGMFVQPSSSYSKDDLQFFSENAAASVHSSQALYLHKTLIEQKCCLVRTFAKFTLLKDWRILLNKGSAVNCKVEKEYYHTQGRSHLDGISPVALKEMRCYSKANDAALPAVDYEGEVGSAWCYFEVVVTNPHPLRFHRFNTVCKQEDKERIRKFVLGVKLEDPAPAFSAPSELANQIQYSLLQDAQPRESWENGESSASVVNKLKCPHCNYIAKHRRTLKRHLIIHSGVRSFSCDICGKLFTRREHVKRHSLVHKKDKKYKCMVCKKIFMLAASVGIRHGSRRYGVCVDCADSHQGSQEGLDAMQELEFSREDDFEENEAGEGEGEGEEDLGEEGEEHAENDQAHWEEADASEVCVTLEED